jgi:putative tryptophan/tyrosine transport system substrate-binding protein
MTPLNQFMMRNRWAIAIAASLIMLVTGCSKPASEQKPLRIGLVYIGPHELINQIVDGFKQGVSESLNGKGYEVIEKHANNDKSQISPTVSGAIASRLDVIATITTPVSQVALKNAPVGLPVVFVGVTDPVGAGLAKSMEKPELSTGVSDLAPLAKLLSTIHELFPGIKKIGFPYSPDEEPAIFSRKLVEKLAPEFGLVIDARPATSRDELPSLLRELIRVNDAILVGADNGMFEAAPNIAKIALDSRKPFFAADSSSVKAGAVAGVTIDYRQVGLAGGKLAVRVAKGEHAGTIPVTLMTEGVLELNRRTINTLKLPVPETVWKTAKTVYE